MLKAKLFFLSSPLLFSGVALSHIDPPPTPIILNLPIIPSQSPQISLHTFANTPTGLYNVRCQLSAEVAKGALTVSLLKQDQLPEVSCKLLPGMKDCPVLGYHPYQAAAPTPPMKGATFAVKLESSNDFAGKGQPITMLVCSAAPAP